MREYQNVKIKMKNKGKKIKIKNCAKNQYLILKNKHARIINKQQEKKKHTIYSISAQTGKKRPSAWIKKNFSIRK